MTIRTLSAAALATATLGAGAPAMAATPKSGKWAGTTTIVAKGTISVPTATEGPVEVPYNVTQVVPIKFRVGSKGVSSFSLGRFKVPCQSGKVAAVNGMPSSQFNLWGAAKISDGAFKFTRGFGYTDVSGRGAFSSRTKAAGTLKYVVQDQFTSDGKCVAVGKDGKSKLKWTAKRVS